jgi:hypothetical protein
VSNELLTIGFSTLSERINNIEPPRVSVPHKVFISIQDPHNSTEPLPSNFKFDSIKSAELGVAKSRNTVLRNAETKYLLFADDEIVFLDRGVKSAVAYLEAHPECDLVLAQAIDTTGALRKRYSKKKVQLTKFNSAKAATYEMIVRVESIKSKDVYFDEKFGAGVSNYIGDEYIFITDLLNKGGTAMFLPITIAIHPKDSSGSLWGTERDLLARAQVFQRVFGSWAPIVRAAFYFKNYGKTNGLRNFKKFVRGKI